MFLHMKQQTIGYCHRSHGCKVAIDHLYGINGIAKSPSNDTFYVGQVFLGGISVLSKQNDGRLVLDEVIPTGIFLLNLICQDLTRACRSVGGQPFRR
jgi:arylesterase/paraoxonase